jgi:hypothetical protein
MTKDGSIRVGLVSLAKIDITAAQTTPFFNQGNLIGQMRAIEEGGLSPKPSQRCRQSTMCPKARSSA